MRVKYKQIKHTAFFSFWKPTPMNIPVQIETEMFPEENDLTKELG